MKVTIVALLLFSCIMCVRMDRLPSTYGWTNNPYNYPNLRQSSIPIPLQSRASTPSVMPPNMTNITENDVMKAVLQISRGSEKFSFEFFRLISNAVSRLNLNFVVSPFTVWSLLILLAEGAGGETYNQMEKVLYLPPELTYVRTAYKAFQRTLNVNTSTIELAVNQAIYTDIHRPIYQHYADILEKDYEADHIAVNFRDASIAIKSINDHVLEQTRGKITEIVKESDLNNAKLLLTSAIYFKGQWKFPFNASFTTEQPFYDELGNLIENVPMMYQIGSFPAASIRALNATVLELPYGIENRLCMLLLLPYKSLPLSTVFDKLADYSIDMIISEVHKYDHDEDPEENEVELSLPRFTISSDLNLNTVLETMGITDLFTTERANLTKMSQDPIFVSSVIHKAIIEVNEVGTEAAAAAGGTVAFKQHPSAFNCNRPFGFLIVERLTNTLVFSGQVRQPSIRS